LFYKGLENYGSHIYTQESPKETYEGLEKELRSISWSIPLEMLNTIEERLRL